jgi:hypothetical protein
MSGVFRNIDPPPPHRPASVCPLAFGAWGGHTLARGRGGGGANSSEDARQCSVLYSCKYYKGQILSLYFISTLYVLCGQDKRHKKYEIFFLCSS